MFTLEKGNDLLASLNIRIEMLRARFDLSKRLWKELQDAMTAHRGEMLAGRVRRRAAHINRVLAHRLQAHLAIIEYANSVSATSDPPKDQAQVRCSASIGISIVNEPRTMHRRGSRLPCSYVKQPPTSRSCLQ